MTVEIFPLSFKEFIEFHKIFLDGPPTFDTKTTSKLRKSAKDYLEIGGFPEVQHLERHPRMEILQRYIDSVLPKNIIEMAFRVNRNTFDLKLFSR